MIRGYESNVKLREFRPGEPAESTKRRWIRSRVVINGVELLTARSIHGVQPLILKRKAAKQQSTLKQKGSPGHVYSFQSHTCLIKFVMLTFLFLISCTHGCSSIRQGVARRGGSFSKLVIKLAFRKIKNEKTKYIPAFDEVFEVVRPANAILWLILQLGNRLADDIS